MSLRKGQAVMRSGLQQLVSEDPGQLLLYALEHVQTQAHHLRVGRVLKRLARRDESPGWIHVSDCREACQRVLGALLLGYRFPRSFTPRQQRILENGQFVHLRWQNTLLSLPPAYQVEIAKVYRRWPIIGEADALVSHLKLGDFIIEIKSMNDTQFSGLREPTADHVFQLNSYLGLDGQARRGLFFYESKDTQDVKIFVLEYNPRPFQEARQRVLEVAALVAEGRLPPACGACEWDAKLADIRLDEDRVAAVAGQLREHADEVQ